MGVKIRCPHCLRYFGAPDLESVKVYAAQGGMIQTLTERIVAQPIHKHYHTPTPVMLAHITMIPITCIGVSVAMYNHVDGIIILSAWSAVCWSIYAFAATYVEVVEKNESQPEDEPEELESQPVAPQPFIEVRKPGPNSLAIRVAHEPPASEDPKRQRTLGKADIVLARLATGDNPIEPISWDNAKAHGFKTMTNGLGEKTFYEVQDKWIHEGLAHFDNRGHCYLTVGGRHTLTRYAQQVIN